MNWDAIDLQLVLPVIWFGVIGFGVLMYVLLDGWRVMTFSGFVALLAGWFVVEIGRQPYVIYGLMRTSEAVSPNIQAAAVLGSLVTFFVAYAIVFGAGFWYLLKLVRRGPLPQEPAPDTHEGERTPMRPLSVGNRPLDEAAPEAPR